MAQLNFLDIQRYFHLPLKEAAKELNVGESHLKKMCRKNKIDSWPYRKIRSLRINIAGLKNQLEQLEDNTNETIFKNNNEISYDSTIVASIIITAKTLSDNLINEIKSNQEKLRQLYEDPNMVFIQPTKKSELDELNDLKKRAKLNKELLLTECSTFFLEEPCSKFQKLHLHDNLDNHLKLPQIPNEIQSDKLFELMEKQAIIILTIEKKKKQLMINNQNV